jgi:hypothetical protein
MVTADGRKLGLERYRWNRDQVRAAARRRQSPILGTSALVGPDAVRDLAPDEAQEGGGLLGKIGRAIGDAAGFAFHDVPALGLQAGLSLYQIHVDPLRGVETTIENFARAAGINLDLPDMPSTGEVVPGVLPQGEDYELDPHTRAEMARAQQDLELGQELFTAPLLGKVTPAGIGRVALDPWNVVRLPIGIVGKVAMKSPAGRVLARSTLLGQAAAGVRGLPELVKVPFDAASAVGRSVPIVRKGFRPGRRPRDQQMVVMDRSSVPEATLRAKPGLIILEFEEVMAETAARIAAKLSLAGRTPVIGETVQSGFNQLRGRIPRTTPPDEISALASEWERMIEKVNNIAERAQTVVEGAFKTAAFPLARDGSITMTMRNTAAARTFMRQQQDEQFKQHAKAVRLWKQAKLVKGEAAGPRPVAPIARSVYGMQQMKFQTFGDLMEHSDLVWMTGVQREMFQITNAYIAVANDALHAIDPLARIDAEIPLGWFFPRKVIGKDGVEFWQMGTGARAQLMSKSGALGSKSTSSYNRVFEEMSQGASRGFDYSTDIPRIVGTYLRGTYREALDRNMGKMVAHLPEATSEAAEGFAAAGQRRLSIMGPATYLPEESAARISKFMGDPTPLTGPIGLAVSALENFNVVAVPAMTTLDISGSMIQGGISLFSHPVAWSRAVGIATASLVDDTFYQRFLLSKADVAARHQSLAFVGESNAAEFMFSAPAFLRRIAGREDALGKATKFAGFFPKMANLHFSRFGNVLRLELAQGVDDTAAAVGRTMTRGEVDAVDKVLNNITGTGTKGFGQGDRAGIFAPKFFRAQLDLISTALLDGTIAGDLARQNLSRFFVLGAMTTKFINDANGWETIWDPTDPNFMRIRAFGLDISLFGTYDTLIKAVAVVPEKGFHGAAAQLAEGKASPAVHRMLDIYRGYNWDGKSIKFDSLDSIASSFGLMALEQAPISVANIVEGTEAAIKHGSGPGAILGMALLEFVGTKSSPLSVGDRFAIEKDAAAVAWGRLNGERIVDYDALVALKGSYAANNDIQSVADEAGELSPLQILRAESTIEQAARMRSGALSVEGQFFFLQNKIRDEALEREQEMNKLVEDGKWTPTEFRSYMTQADHDKSVKLAQLVEDPRYAKVVDKFKQSPHPVDVVISRYFDLYEEASDAGFVNYGRLDGLRENLRLEVGEDVWRRVEGALLNRKRDTLWGEKLRIARQKLAPLFRVRESLFRELKQHDPALQEFDSLAHMEADIRARAFDIDPTGRRVDAIVRWISGQSRSLRRINSVNARYRTRMVRRDPEVALAMKTFYA